MAGSAEALAGLIRLAKARGAQSVLLQTWAYAAGDPDNGALFPDYPAMQAGAHWCLAFRPGAALVRVAGSGGGAVCRTVAGTPASAHDPRPGDANSGLSRAVQEPYCKAEVRLS